MNKINFDKVMNEIIDAIENEIGAIVLTGAGGEGKGPASAVSAGDDLAGEREHENDRGVKNETTNSCASV